MQDQHSQQYAEFVILDSLSQLAQAAAIYAVSLSAYWLCIA